MQSPLAAPVDQFQDAQQHQQTFNYDDEAPFDCNTPTKPAMKKPPMVPKSQTLAVKNEYSYEDGPSFDCDEPPEEMGKGVKVDLMMGITPVKSNKSNNNSAANVTTTPATVMTEPVTPSPFKTPASSSTRRIMMRTPQPFDEEENPFDESPFDEGPSMTQEDDMVRLDTGVASPTVSNKTREEQEPAGPLMKRAQRRAAARTQQRQDELMVASSPTEMSRNHRRRGDMNSTSAHSSSTCEEVADADIDYEADVDPYSDDDDGTTRSEKSGKQRRRRVGAQIVHIDRTKKKTRSKAKPNKVEEWCLSNVFDNIATDAALDVADWFTEGYTQGSKHAKNLVVDCLVPLKETVLNGEDCGEDGEQMIQLLRNTNDRSDLHFIDEAEDFQSSKSRTPRSKKKVSKRKQKYRSTNMVDDSIDEDSLQSYQHTRQPLKRIESSSSKRSSRPTEVRTEAPKLTRVDSKLAAPTVMTKTRSLLEDTPTREAPVVLYDARLNEMGNLGSNSFDSNSTARTENLSVHQVDKEDDDDVSVKSTVNSSKPIETLPQQPQEDSDDESVLDQAAEMAALVATKPPAVSPPPQPEKPTIPSDNRASEPTTNVEKKEEQPTPFKMPMTTQKLTMAQAKEVLKAAKKSNGGIHQATPMFLEMEPEPKYVDQVASKKKEWPPKNMEASVPKSYKPPSRTSKPVDRFGYMAALKDKSNTSTDGQKAVREEWW